MKMQAFPQKIVDVLRYLSFKTLLMPYLSNDCPKERHGSDYGGWYITPRGLNDQSIVYSFGIGEDISFDLSIIEKYGCQVFAFDPTPKSLDWLEKQSLPSQFRYFGFGLADFDGHADFFSPPNPNHVSHTMIKDIYSGNSVQVEVFKLQTIMQRMGHTQIDILKMDIEGAEYAVIHDVIASALKPKQLLVEFHDRFRGTGGILRTVETVRQLRRYGYSLFSVSKTLTEFSFVSID